MDTLKQKIAKTNLFSADEKIRLLVRLDELDDHQKEGIGDVIDEFDSKHKKVLKEYKQESIKDADALKNSVNNPKVNEVVDLLKKGLNTLLPDL